MQMPAEVENLNGRAAASDASKSKVDVKGSTCSAFCRPFAAVPHQLLFNYVGDIIRTAKVKKSLEVRDIPVHVDLQTAQLYERFDHAWASRKATNIKNVVRALCAGSWGSIVLTGVGYIISQGSQLAGPLLLGRIVGGLSCRETPGCAVADKTLYSFAIGLFIAPFIEAFVENYKNYELEKLGVIFRNTLMAAIYRKCLRLDNAAMATHSTGKIVTLMSNDAQKIQEVMMSIHMVWGSPLLIIAIVGLLYREVEWACFVGLAVMLLLVPITAIIGKRLGLYRREIVAWTDKRTSIMSEVVNGMRVIKFYNWEEPFKTNATSFRNEEAKRMLRIAWLQGAFGLVLFVGPVLVAVSSFAAYTVAGNKLTPKKVFTALPLFTLLRFPMGFLPSVLLALINCKVALTRILGFLSSTEVTDSDPGFSKAGTKGAVAIKDGSFKWDEDEDRQVTLRNINLNCAPGTLTMIVGAVGCGKSSLLGTLFQQITRRSGTVEIGGTLAYVPQSPWIMNDTVRENIVMGAEFIESKYKAVLTAAQLATDLEQFSNGDLTEIGERGITVSGGQKQRIAMARAVYADADIYVLDDPLSAVDAHVGSALFEDCLCGALRGKTVLLVTNALQHVHRADKLVWLVNGEIRKQGTYQEVNVDAEFVELVGSHVIAEGDDADGSEKGEKIAATRGAKGKAVAEVAVSGGKERGLTGNEDRNTGGIGGRVVASYVKAGGGLLWALPLVFAFACEQAVKTFTDYWLIFWTKDQFNIPLGAYIGLYLALALVFGAITYTRAITFAFGAVRAAVNLHTQLLAKVMMLPMSFFDTNPSGRVINRFSRDTEMVDAVLPLSLIQLGACVSNYLGIIVFICFAVPWFTVAIPPLSLAYVLLQRYYIPGARELQRLEAVVRSPIYTGFSEAVNGIVTIRAYAREAHFTRIEDNLIWSNGIVYLMQRAAAGWLSIRLDFLGLTVLTSAAMLAVRLNIEPGKAGLALTYALDLTKFLKFGARLASKAESDFNSVERMVQYLDEESEAEHGLPSDPDADEWPTHGKVVVRKIALRYRPDLPLVLKNVSFDVAPGQHIGIVGRTGSGKSTLMLAFFRMVELDSGDILIDSRSLSTLGLSVVRTSFSMIPQDPFMFSGSVRRNLDPIDQYSDADVWKAIERVELKPVIAGMDKKLDSPVADGGSNFSQGQRQLFCLARALLKRTRILMMDEATASVDLDTDVLIQKVVRTEFADCTVLTIAHRLNTIMDSDKVLVMDAGYAAEYDVPHKLLQDEHGIFTSLVNNTGANAARKLRNIANRSYGKLLDALHDNDGPVMKAAPGGKGEEDKAQTVASDLSIHSLQPAQPVAGDAEHVLKVASGNFPPASQLMVSAVSNLGEEEAKSASQDLQNFPPASQLMVSAVSNLGEGEAQAALQGPPATSHHVPVSSRNNEPFTMVDNLMAADMSGDLFQSAASSPVGSLPSSVLQQSAKAQPPLEWLGGSGSQGCPVRSKADLPSEMFITAPGSRLGSEPGSLSGSQPGITMYDNAAAGLISPPRSQDRDERRLLYTPKLDLKSEQERQK
jgi:ATP-binding cassette, subfamily C (CFTR/MRP), member 1